MATDAFDPQQLQDDLDFRMLAEGFYLKTLDQLTVNLIPGESGLPGWSRKHVAVHMINNAEGLMRLLEWARTGVKNPMYPSREVRNQEIEAGVVDITDSDVRAISHEVTEEMTFALTQMDDAAWAAQVVDGQGIPITTAAIPWMRAREAFLHALDLNIGMSALDFPATVATRLLRDVVATWDGRGEPAHFRLHVTDRPDDPDLADWLVATGDAAAFAPEPVEVTGEAAELASYLLGRGWPRGDSTVPVGLPHPPRWR